MSSSALNIIWFRQDLRAADNPALATAAKQGSVLQIYILDDENAGNSAMGASSRTWLHHSQKALNQSLDDHLSVFCGDAIYIIGQLIEQLPVQSVYWNRCWI